MTVDFCEVRAPLSYAVDVGAFCSGDKRSGREVGYLLLQRLRMYGATPPFLVGLHAVAFSGALGKRSAFNFPHPATV